MQQIVWQPQPKQKLALSRTEYEVLYGGARGGGKTDAGIMFPLYHIKNPRFRCLVIRRNADDLKDWIDRAEIMYQYVDGKASGKPAEFKFPSGAIIRTGHLKDDTAYTKYQGHEYQNMILEELTHIPREDDYIKLISSCRSTVDGIKPQIFSTTNPGHVGHEWVKRRFVDVAEPTTTYIDPKTGRTRIFIPARIEDNSVLVEKDPDYVRFLDGLPDGLRQQWREGSWENYEIQGAVYAAELAQMDKEKRITRVPVEPSVPVNTYWDLGYGDYMAIWFVQFVGLDVRLVDYYSNFNQAMPHYIQLLKEKNYIYGDHWAPHDIEVHEYSTGKTRREAARSLGLNFKVQPKSSLEDGINAVRILFPRIWIDRERCAEGIRALKNYQRLWDETRLQFKKEPDHSWASHSSDALRGLALSYREPIREQYSENESYSKYDLI